MFTQPTPVLSLGSDLRSQSLSSQPPSAPVGEQTSLLGWGVLVCTDPRLCQWRGFLVCGNFSSFTATSHSCRSHPYSFVSVFSFFFCPTQVRGEFLAFWEVWGLLTVFSRCSVGVVPHVDVFLMYLWGGRWSPCLTLPPSWRSPSILHFLYPLSRQSTFTSFYSLAIVNNAAMHMRVQVFLWDTDFSSFVYMVRSGIAVSYGSSIFNHLFLLNLVAPHISNVSMSIVTCQSHTSGWILDKMGKEKFDHVCRSWVSQTLFVKWINNATCMLDFKIMLLWWVKQ